MAEDAAGSDLRAIVAEHRREALALRRLDCALRGDPHPVEEEGESYLPVAVLADAVDQA